LCVVVIAICLLILGVRWATQEPSFIEPRVIASKKYEPNPRPMNLKVTDEVKERAQYKVISRITE
jgi:hypothetical protein